MSGFDTSMVLFPLLVFFCLLSAFTTCALGFFVYAKNTKSPVNQLFLASMLGGMFWALGEFFLWQAGTYDGTVFWLKASSFWPVAIALTVHFVLAYSDHPLARPGKSRLLIACLYIPAIIFTLLGLFTDSLYVVADMPGTGFMYRPATDSLPHLAVCVFIIMAMAGAILAANAAWVKATSGKKRGQVRLLFIAILTLIVFGSISGVLHPLLGVYTPNVVFIGLFLFSLIITYAINRYGLFLLTPETALPSILRTMPDGFILMAMTGRIITVNASAARILRAREEEMAGQQLSRFLPVPECEAVLASIAEQGTFLDLESLLDKKENIVVSIAGSPVRDPEGESAGIVLIIRDISNRKRQERALKVANEKISLLSHLTRHDINNLVTGLSGYLMLLEDSNTASPGKEYLCTAIELVDKITRHLRFSSEYLYIGTYEPSWQSLETMVTDAQNDLPQDKVTITQEIFPVDVYTDTLSVKVIYNLLENALRHGGNLTAITIKASVQENGWLVVAVEDDGVGIPDADKEKIFEYGVGSHTGLGLAFARDILEVTGITIRETGIAGKGARFEIHVPPSSWRRA
ncbi:MAG: ATP-binding protein [Methanoregula sp.]